MKPFERAELKLPKRNYYFGKYVVTARSLSEALDMLLQMLEAKRAVHSKSEHGAVQRPL